MLALDEAPLDAKSPEALIPPYQPLLIVVIWPAGLQPR